MEYQLTGYEENEKHLFYRLDGEAAERHGAIGYMRMDFGKDGKEFWTAWIDNQKHLKTPEFKAGFDGVINHLRYGTEHPPFGNRREMRIFVRGHSELHISDHAIGFKIQTPDYTYCALCRPFGNDYDARVYAYDNRWLLPELAGRHELPEMCYSTLPTSGEIILIKRGEKGYCRCEHSTQDEQYNREYARDGNIRLGVTRAQEEAMYVGSLFGWDMTAAKPWNYDDKGNFRAWNQPKKNEPER